MRQKFYHYGQTFPIFPALLKDNAEYWNLS